MTARKAGPKSLTPKRRPTKTDGRSDAPSSPLSRKPPAISGKTRIVISQKAPGAQRAKDKPASETPTLPPPPPDPPARSRPPARSAVDRQSLVVRKRPQRGIAVDEVTANLSKDPRAEEDEE